MAAIGKAQIEVAVDASGVDVGVSKAKRSLAGLADAAAEAGARGARGVGAIGDGGDSAAKKVEQTTKAMIGSIQRATAAMEAGSKSGAAYYAALAAQRGVDPNVLKPYLAQLDAAKAKQEALARASAATSQSMAATIPTFNTLTGAISSVQSTLAGLAAAAGITWAAGLVKGAIDGMAALHTLSERTGATVEGLSAMRGAAKLSGTSMDSVAGAMQRLSKNMVTMDDDGKAATKAIAAIGLSADDLRKMKPDEAFKAIADSLAQYEGGANKVAIAQALMGKSGADMLPMLANLAETGKLQAKVTAEQASQAYEFDKSLIKLGATGQGWQKEIAAGMLPTLNDFATALLSVANEASGLRNATARLSQDGSINAWATDAVNAATHVIDAFAGVVRVVQLAAVAVKAVGQYSTAVDDIHAMGPLAPFTGAGREALTKRQGELFKTFEDAGAEMKNLLTTPLIGQRIREAFAKTTEAKTKALQDYAAAAKDVAAAYAGQDVKIAQAAQKALKESYFGADKRVLDFTTTREKAAKGGGGGGGGASQEASEYNKLSDAIDKYISRVEAEIAGEAKLTEAQKIGLDVKRKLSAADQQLIKSALEKARSLESALEMQKLWQQAEDEARKSEQARADALRNGAVAIAADAEKIREHTREIGLSQSAIESIRASRDADTLATQTNELALLDATGQCTAYSEALRDNIAALGDRADALRGDAIVQAAADSAKKAKDNWTETAKSIEQSLTDALLRGFESGKDFATNLRDTVINMFKTLILRPIIQATVTGTLMGGSASAGASTDGTIAGAIGGNTGSIASTLSNLKSTYDMITGGFENTYNSLARSSIGQQLGLSSAANYGSATGGLGATATEIAIDGGVLGGASETVLTSLGTNIGTGLATAGAGLIGNAIGSAIAGDKRIISGVSTATVGAALGAFAGPIGALAGGAIGGLLDAAFGSGKKEIKASGISGTFSGAEFAGQSWDFWRKSGGWFGGGGKGTDYSPLDSDTTTALSSSFALLKLQTGKAAEALGVDTQAIANYSKMIQVQMTEDATANAKAISDMLGGISDDLSKLALSGTNFGAAGETASQTLVRLSTSLVAVNDGLALAHLQVLGVSLSAGDMASKLASATGGIDAFKMQISSYYDAYFSDAEKQADLTASLAKSFAAMGLALPDSKSAFRSLVESLDLTTTSGQSAFAGLMAVSGAFAQMTDTADAAKKAAEDAAKAAETAAREAAEAAAAAAREAAEAAAATYKAITDGLQQTAASNAISLLEAQGRKEEAAAAIRGAAIVGMDAMQSAMYDANIATQKLTQSLIDQSGRQAEIDRLTMTGAQLHAKELATLDPANAALQQRIYLLGIESQQRGLDIELMTALGNAEGALAATRADALAKLDVSLQGTQRAIWAAQDASAAAAKAQSAADEAAAKAKQQADDEANAARQAVADAKSAYDQRLQTARSDLQAAYNAEASALESIIGKMGDFSRAARDLISVLVNGDSSPMTASQKYSLAKAGLPGVTARANAGDQTALDDLRSFVDVSKASSADFVSYARDFASVVAILDASATTAEDAESLAKRQLDALKKSVDGLFEVKRGVLTVADAIAELNKVTAGGLLGVVDAIGASANISAAAIAAAMSSSSTVTKTSIQTPAGQAAQLAYENASWSEASDAAARAYGDAITAYNEATLSEHYGGRRVDDAYRAEIFRSFGVPGYAGGGDFAGGLRIVGEHGRELEATGPARIWSASETRSMLGGGGEMAAEIRALRAEVAALRAENSAENRAIASSSGKTARLLERAMPDGDAIATREAA